MKKILNWMLKEFGKTLAVLLAEMSVDALIPLLLRRSKLSMKVVRHVQQTRANKGTSHTVRSDRFANDLALS